MTYALIKPQILRWARERLHSTIEAKRRSQAKVQTLVKLEERLKKWEKEESRPTFRQAQSLARALQIPFGYLFSAEPPSSISPIPDLRTLEDAQSEEPSLDLLAVISDALRKQDWYREELLEEGEESLPFVGRFSSQADAAEIARNIRETLGINAELRKKAKSWKEFLTLLTVCAEDAGILVLRSGIVGNNTHRKLSKDEFLGFALGDPWVPLVFLNNDYEARRIFTLAHELAHIWIGESGVSNHDPARISLAGEKKVERLCDRIAAEVLAPRDEFLAKWQGGITAEENVARLVSHFRVSSLVVLRRALDLRKISKPKFFEEYNLERQKFWERDERNDNKGGGGDFHKTLPVRNSRKFTTTVLTAAVEGRVLYRDAARLLGLKSIEPIFETAVKLGIG